MRKWKVFALILPSLLLFAGSARADDDDDDGPAAAADKPAETNTNPIDPNTDPNVSSAISSDDSGRNVGIAARKAAGAHKSWTVGAVLDTHRMVVQDDLQGAGRNRAMNYLYTFAGYGITKYDRVQVRTGFYQRFIADTGESGLRMDDIEPVYTRTIPLPWKLTARVAASALIPTSYYSQLVDMITAPRLGFQLNRQFGNLNISLRQGNTFWIWKYKASPGGDTLPMYSMSGSLNAEYAMPFHEVLSVGTTFYAGATFNHNPENPNDPNVRRVGGAVTDPYYGNTQPVQNSYGAEVYARYILPEVMGFKTDFTLGFSNGDGTLGLMRLNREGANRIYGFWRTQAAVYAQLGIRY